MRSFLAEVAAQFVYLSTSSASCTWEQLLIIQGACQSPSALPYSGSVGIYSKRPEIQGLPDSMILEA